MAVKRTRGTTDGMSSRKPPAKKQHVVEESEELSNKPSSPSHQYEDNRMDKSMRILRAIEPAEGSKPPKTRDFKVVNNWISL